MRTTRIRAAAALSVLAMLAGCGGDDGGDGEDFAKRPADQIADAAKSDMKELEAVHYTGGIESEGNPLTLDIQASSAGDCTGSVGIGEGTTEVLAKDGEKWFRPDEAFWREQEPDQADVIIQTVGDQWIVDSNSEFAQFCDLDEFFSNIFAEDGDSKYETVGTDELDGDEVVKVENTDDDGTSTGFVLVDDPHYLVKVERTEGESPGQIEFGEFDEEFEVEAPAEDEVIDLEQL